MADADSLHEGNSDLDNDPHGEEADIEDDDVVDTNNEEGQVKKIKKKNKKKKAAASGVSSGDSDGAMNAEDDEEETAAAPAGTSEEVEANALSYGSLDKMSQLQKAMELLKVTQPQGAVAAPRSLEEAKRKSYQFWDTQPVPKIDEEIIATNEAIEADKPISEVREECFSLPAGFQWDTLDINNPTILKELYTLLNENYVEDDDNMFRFDYSREFLMWALQPPGWLKEWHCGVRVEKSKKLVGFISAVPAHMKIYEKVQKMVEINFLCVHKKLRSKRVAPVLIREITRRVNRTGIFQAVYTAGVVLPKPVASCRYWHRSLNPRKLIEVKFSHLSRNMTMQRTLKLYKLPETPRINGFRELTAKDSKKAFTILKEYLLQFSLAPSYSLEEFEHWFMPRPGIVDSYVVEGPGGKITDFVSFYTLPSTVMHHPKYKMLKAAYSFYNVCTSGNWTELMQDTLIAARNQGFDVFNALDLMQNKEFLEKLKFGVGDGNLQYYLYNWKCPSMKPEQVGLVLQ